MLIPKFKSYVEIENPDNEVEATEMTLDEFRDKTIAGTLIPSQEHPSTPGYLVKTLSLQDDKEHKIVTDHLVNYNYTWIPSTIFEDKYKLKES